MNNELLVGDQYRTSHLSQLPGGHTVTVIYDSDKSFTYDKIKKPTAYIRTLRHSKEHGRIVSVIVDNEHVVLPRNLK